MNLYKKFWQIIDSEQRIKSFKLLVATIIGGFFEAVGVALIVPLISLVASDSFNFPTFILDIFPFLIDLSRSEILIYLVAIFLIFFLLKAAYLLFLVAMQARFYYSLQEKVSERLFKSYLLKPYSFHLQNNSAKLLSYTMTESMQFSQGFTAPAVLILNDFFIVIAILITLLIFEPLGALTAFTLFGSMSFLLYYFSRRQSSLWGETRQIKEAHRIKNAQEGLNGIKDVKLYGREETFINKFKESTHSSLEAGRKQTILQNVPRIFLEFIALLALCSLILLFSNSEDTSKVISIIGLFAAAAFKLLPTISRLVQSSQAISFSTPVVGLIFEELVPDSIPADKTTISSDIRLENTLTISKLDFKYEGLDKPSLDSINIDISSGEMIGFIGSSGAGKSTLIDCILGLITPSKGEILVDGKLINPSNIRSWQERIGYVSQVIYLLDGSLRENIAFGIPKEDINEDKILEAIKKSQLSDFVDTLPEGLDTSVGERGVRLSGGQRQRIGIARALYNDPLLLVLDEATSSLDIKTEQEVMKSVEDLHGHNTILIIAHRFSTVENCDFLYKLDKGKIVAKGKPQEVLINK